jgi:hypothetical protein
VRAMWEAIERRFKGDAALVTAARKIYFGVSDMSRKSPPYVNCIIEEQNADLDTFDKDIELYRIRFRIVTQDLRGLAALDIVEHVQRVFDDGLLQSSAFEDTTATRISGSGPGLEPDEPFAAELLYEVVAQRVVDMPVVRG